MKAIIHDLIQSDNSAVILGSDNIKTAALQEVATDANYDITFDTDQLNAIALYNVFYTGAIIRVIAWVSPSVGLTENITNLDTSGPANRIYYLSQTYSGIIKVSVQFLTPASFNYVGRIGAGMARDLPIYKRREPGYKATTENRETLGGQTIEGAGGVSFRRIGFELKAKITTDVYNDYVKAKNYLPFKMPMFFDFTPESKWFPDLGFFYGIDTQMINFQSGLKALRYSKAYIVEERY